VSERAASIEAGFVQQYINWKKHPEQIQYIHPKLEKITSSTFGVIVFQEQLMQILRLGMKDLPMISLMLKRLLNSWESI